MTAPLTKTERELLVRPPHVGRGPAFLPAAGRGAGEPRRVAPTRADEWPTAAETAEALGVTNRSTVTHADRRGAVAGGHPRHCGAAADVVTPRRSDGCGDEDSNSTRSARASYALT